MENANYDSVIRVLATYSEFRGKPGMSLGRVIERIQEFDRDSLAIVLSKILLTIRKPGMASLVGQMRLVNEFLNKQQKKRIKRLKERKRRMYIHQDMVLSLTKLNLQHNSTGGYKLENLHERRILFNLILSLNEIYTKEQQPTPSVGEIMGDEKTFENLRYSMAKQFLGVNQTEIINELYRGAMLYENVKLRLAFDIDQVFRESTGMDLDEYHQMLFGLIVDWVVETDGKPIDQYVLRSLRNFLKPLGFEEEKIDSLESILAVTPEEFEAENQAALTAAKLKDDTYHNYLIFYIKQLLKLGENVICMSPEFLATQFTEGPYNIVRKYLNDNGRTTDAESLVQKWGYAYEDYILERLKNSFGDKLHAKPKAKDGNDTIDAVVELKDCYLLIEIKYPHWRFAQRVDPTVDAINDFIKKFASKDKGLGQIKKFYNLNNSGRLENTFKLKDKVILPIIILGEHFPFDPLNRKVMDDYVESENLLIGSNNVLPYILLYSDEVEMIEGITETYSIEAVEALLPRYAYRFNRSLEATLVHRPTTFRNVISNNRIFVRNSSALSMNLDSFSDRTLARFRAYAANNGPENEEVV